MDWIRTPNSHKFPLAFGGESGYTARSEVNVAATGRERTSDGIRRIAVFSLACAFFLGREPASGAEETSPPEAPVECYDGAGSTGSLVPSEGAVERKDPAFGWFQTAAASQTPAGPRFPEVKIGTLVYFSYQNGSSGGTDYNRFVLKRGYINIEAKLSSFLSARITPDVFQPSTGDVDLRIKYAYAKLTAPKASFITKPEVEFGIAHTPWLDFEEHVNNYRMQDTMFLERVGQFNSADFGVTVMGFLGGTLSEEYQKTVSGAYPGRYGSFAFGVYNGGGYHAAEANQNKVIEERLTVRPLPDHLPGLQVSYFGVDGKGNVVTEPDWTLRGVMASYQHRLLVLTGTWMSAVGNQSGLAVDASGSPLETGGWSVFGEAKLSPSWSAIARYDAFDPDEKIERNDQSRFLAGIAYRLTGNNVILLDYDRLQFQDDTAPANDRVQLTFQVSY